MKTQVFCPIIRGNDAMRQCTVRQDALPSLDEIEGFCGDPFIQICAVKLHAYINDRCEIGQIKKMVCLKATLLSKPNAECGFFPLIFYLVYSFYCAIPFKRSIKLLF